MAKKLSYFLLGLVLVALSACATMVQPQTFQEKLAYAYAGLASSRQIAADLVVSQRISREEGTRLLHETDIARAMLDQARMAHSVGDVDTALGQLLMAQNMLTLLQSYLREKESRK